MKKLLFVLSVGLLGFTSNPFAQSGPTLRGAWRVVSVTTTGPNAATISSPQPGLYIFTARHYSFNRVTSAKARAQLKDPAKVTEAEALAIFGPFQGQAGTYEVAGTNLTVRPLTAKNPEVMASGAFTTYSLKLDGNTLTLTNRTNNAGPITNPATLTLTRIE